MTTAWTAVDAATNPNWADATLGVGAVLRGNNTPVLLGQGGCLLLAQEIDVFTSDWESVETPTETGWTGV